MNKYRMLSTCTVDLPDKLPFEGWPVMDSEQSCNNYDEN